MVLLHFPERRKSKTNLQLPVVHRQNESTNSLNSDKLVRIHLDLQ